MINFNEYPFINICLSFYFRVRNSEMWGGKGSVGYENLSMEECKNINSLTEESIEKFRINQAKNLGVLPDDIDFITKSEYDAAIEQEDEDVDIDCSYDFMMDEGEEEW